MSKKGVEGTKYFLSWVEVDKSLVMRFCVVRGRIELPDLILGILTKFRE